MTFCHHIRVRVPGRTAKSLFRCVTDAVQPNRIGRPNELDMRMAKETRTSALNRQICNQNDTTMALIWILGRCTCLLLTYLLTNSPTYQRTDQPYSHPSTNDKQRENERDLPHCRPFATHYNNNNNFECNVCRSDEIIMDSYIIMRMVIRHYD